MVIPRDIDDPLGKAHSGEEFHSQASVVGTKNASFVRHPLLDGRFAGGVYQLLEALWVTSLQQCSSKVVEQARSERLRRRDS